MRSRIAKRYWRLIIAEFLLQGDQPAVPFQTPNRVRQARLAHVAHLFAGYGSDNNYYNTLRIVFASETEHMSSMSFSSPNPWNCSAVAEK